MQVTQESRSENVGSIEAMQNRSGLVENRRRSFNCWLLARMHIGSGEAMTIRTNLSPHNLLLVKDTSLDLSVH